MVDITRDLQEHHARNLWFSIAGVSCMVFIILSYGLSKDDYLSSAPCVVIRFAKD